MWRRIALIAIIAGSYAGAMYTETGCSPTETSPTQPPLVYGTLRGTVTDAKNGAAIPGATVAALHTSGSSGTTLFTDNNGQYQIGILAGTVNVTVSKASYQTFTTTTTVPENGVTTLDVKLQPM